MLGCHDFCGHYDWTFHYMRRKFGQESVHKLWAEAIGGESQDHYRIAGRANGLQGLYDVWTQTGVDEKCDWTFTLDKEKQVLRMDMRKCPSKGFLLGNDRNADEDYCDHCAGWVAPLLGDLGLTVAAHEHNHAGQCWWELQRKDRPYTPLTVSVEIRNDPRWNQGFVERWEWSEKKPLLPGVSSSPDSPQVLMDYFAQCDRLVVLGRGPSAVDAKTKALLKEVPARNVIVTDPTYASRDVFDGEPGAVLVGDRSQVLADVAKRFNATAAEKRPLLMHLFLPGVPMIDFVSFGLPRPVPILPLLIRQGVYTHQPNHAYPTTGVFAVLLATALGKPTDVAGIDLYRHPSGQTYVSGPQPQTKWPAWHSEACDRDFLHRAKASAKAPLRWGEPLASLLAGQA